MLSVMSSNNFPVTHAVNNFLDQATETCGGLYKHWLFYPVDKR